MLKRLRRSGEIAEYVQDAPVQTAILEFLKKGPKPRKDIYLAMEQCSKKAIDKALEKMRDKGLVANDSREWFIVKQKKSRKKTK